MDLLTIGTIITSYLTFEEFKTASGDPKVWDPAHSAWSPADGRVVSHSKFNAATNKLNAPDYRGVFLRCNNVIDPANTSNIPPGQADPDGTRSRDVFQGDTYTQHTHSYTGLNLVAQGGSGFWGTGFDSNSGAGSKAEVSSVAGGNETRSKNYAVYFYIRIN